MFNRMNAMYDRAYREVEAIGDQVGARSPETVYFPFDQATMTGVLVTGHEDQYLVLFGPEGEPFLTVRQDGKVMTRPAPAPHTGLAECQAIELLGHEVSTAYYTVRTFSGLLWNGERSVLTVKILPLPGRGRSYLWCRGWGPDCQCFRDSAGVKVEPETIDRVLAQDWLERQADGPRRKYIGDEGDNRKGG